MKFTMFEKQSHSIKMKAATVMASVILAVALPWMFHALGRVLNIGTSAGEIFLPMHFPVMIAGFLAGPAAGLAAGILSPVISFMITGMPVPLMLPFIAIELAAYGAVSGAVSNVRMNGTLKVLAVQAAGRAVRAVAILFAVYALSSKVNAHIIYTSIVTGLPGIALQLLTVPYIVKKMKNE